MLKLSRDLRTPESTPDVVLLPPPPITLLRPTAVVSLLVSGLSAVAFRSPTVGAASLRVLPGLDRLPSRTARLSVFRSGELSLLVPPGLA